MKYCVIGMPIAQSRSPELFGCIFAERKLGHTYERREIRTEEELKRFFDEMRAGVWGGCNITMPWKTLSIAHLDDLTADARLIGACNTVKCVNGRLIGHATDGVGMIHAIEAEQGCVTADKRVAVIGCGGAARAVIAAMARYGVAEIAVIAREGANLELTTRLKEELEEAGCQTSIRWVDFYDTARVIAIESSADILINCTPIGMKPDITGIPIPEELELRPDMIVADAVYEPEETCLLRKARRAGCITVPGLRMLEGQAYEGAKFFFD